jgi:hypothetical protein
MLPVLRLGQQWQNQPFRKQLSHARFPPTNNRGSHEWPHSAQSASRLGSFWQSISPNTCRARQPRVRELEFKAVLGFLSTNTQTSQDRAARRSELMTHNHLYLPSLHRT